MILTTKRNEEKRVCRLCEEEKTLEMFEIDRRVKGGRTNRCKACKAGLNDRSRTLYSGLKYRAERDSQALEVTLKELRRLYRAFDGKCIYCNKTEEEAGVSHHVDHFIPVSRGGRHHINNLVLSCASCNRSKQDQPFLSFYFRNQDVISAENFNTVIYYLALMNEQSVDELLADLFTDYKRYKHEGITNIFTEEEIREIALKKIKTEAI